jgi:hypothetical protein
MWGVASEQVPKILLLSYALGREHRQALVNATVLHADPARCRLALSSTARLDGVLPREKWKNGAACQRHLGRHHRSNRGRCSTKEVVAIEFKTVLVTLDNQRTIEADVGVAQGWMLVPGILPQAITSCERQPGAAATEHD